MMEESPNNIEMRENTVPNNLTNQPNAKEEIKRKKNIETPVQTQRQLPANLSNRPDIENLIKKRKKEATVPPGAITRQEGPIQTNPLANRDNDDFDYQDTRPTAKNRLMAHYYLGRQSASTEVSRKMADTLEQMVQDARGNALGDATNYFYKNFTAGLSTNNLNKRVNWAQAVIGKGQQDDSYLVDFLKQSTIGLVGQIAGELSEDFETTALKFSLGGEVGHLAAKGMKKGLSIAAVKLGKSPIIEKVATRAVEGAVGTLAAEEVGRAYTEEYRKKTGRELTEEQLAETRKHELVGGAIGGVVIGATVDTLAKWRNDYITARTEAVNKKATEFVESLSKEADEVTAKYESQMDTVKPKEKPAEKTTEKITEEIETKPTKEMAEGPIEEPTEELTKEPIEKPTEETTPQEEPYTLGSAGEHIVAEGKDTITMYDLGAQGAFSIEKIPVIEPAERWGKTIPEPITSETTMQPTPTKTKQGFAQNKAVTSAKQLGEELLGAYKTVINSKKTKLEKLRFLSNQLLLIDPMKQALSNNFKSLLFKGLKIDKKGLKYLHKLMNDPQNKIDFTKYYMEGAPIPSNNTYAKDLLKLAENLKKYDNRVIKEYGRVGTPIQKLQNRLPQPLDRHTVASIGIDEFTNDLLKNANLKETFGRIAGEEYWQSLSPIEQQELAKALIKGEAWGTIKPEKGLFATIIADDGYTFGLQDRKNKHRFIKYTGEGYINMMEKYGRSGSNPLLLAMQESETNAMNIATQAAFGLNGQNITREILKDMSLIPKAKGKSKAFAEYLYEKQISNMSNYLFENRGFGGEIKSKLLRNTFSAISSTADKLTLVNSYVWALIEEPLTMMYNSISRPEGWEGLIKEMGKARGTKKIAKQLRKEMTQLALQMDIQSHAVGNNNLFPASMKGLGDKYHAIMNSAPFVMSDNISNTHKFQARTNFQMDFGRALKKSTMWADLKGSRDILNLAGISEKEWNMLLANKDQFLTHWTPADPVMARTTNKVPFLNFEKGAQTTNKKLNAIASKIATAQEIFVNRSVLTGKTMSRAAILGGNAKGKGFTSFVMNTIFGKFAGPSMQKLVGMGQSAGFMYHGKTNKRIMAYLLHAMTTGTAITAYKMAITGERPNYEDSEWFQKLLFKTMVTGEVLPFVGTLAQNAFYGAKGNLENLGQMRGESIGAKRLLTLADDIRYALFENEKNTAYQTYKRLKRHIPGYNWHASRWVVRPLVDAIFSEINPDAVGVFNQEIANKRKYSDNIFTEYGKPGAFTKYADIIKNPSEDAKKAALNAMKRKEKARLKKQGGQD